MLIKQFVRKNALNSISGETFSKESKRLFAEPRQSRWISSIHNWMKQNVLNLKLFMNEGGLYKMDQIIKKKLLTSCSFITSRADTDAVY